MVLVASDEDLIVTMRGLVQARKIGGRGVHREKAFDSVIGKILVAHRELEDVFNIRIGVRVETRKWWLM